MRVLMMGLMVLTKYKTTDFERISLSYFGIVPDNWNGVRLLKFPPTRLQRIFESILQVMCAGLLLAVH